MRRAVADAGSLMALEPMALLKHAASARRSPSVLSTSAREDGSMPINSEASEPSGRPSRWGRCSSDPCVVNESDVGALPILRSVVLDTTDARALAEFYRELLGYHYRPGDEPPSPGEPDPKGSDWLVLLAADGPRLAFQNVERVARPTWPDDAVPQQLHLDLSVPSREELATEHVRILALGALVLADRSDDPEEPLYVYADPAGHPFCLFVADSDAEKGG